MSTPPAKRATPAESAWMVDAACLGVEVALFFPSNGIDGTQDSPAAKRVCRTCPVRWRCLRHAVLFHEQGIWGGSSDPERKAIRRRLRVLQAGLARQALAELADSA